MSLSKRGERAILPPLPYFALQASVQHDLYDAVSNPHGAIPMCVAESRGQFYPAFADRLAAARAGTIEAGTGQYTNMSGRDRFRAAVASTISRTVLGGRLELEPSAFVISSGCGALLLQLSLLLLDEGDCVLLPTPTYPALYNDVQTLAAGRIIDVPISGDNFRLTRSALDRAAERAGGRARILLLLNPSNPLGVVHSAAEMRMAAAWVRERGIHLISGEGLNEWDKVLKDNVHAPHHSREGAHSDPTRACKGAVGITSP